MSATSRPADHRFALDRAGGFTLLEILVVLVLLGVMVGVALPSLGRVYDQVSWRLYRDDVERQLAGLRLEAYLAGRDLVLVSEAGEPPLLPGSDRPLPVRLELPAGWQARVVDPILYRADGICRGGVIDIAAGNLVSRYTFEPPRCWPPQRQRLG